MAQKKKPVGDQPLCLADEIRRIEPVWRSGRVPNGFWQTRQNRRNYLLWLGHKLGFRRLRDWYRLTYEDLASHRGCSLANSFWTASPIPAVKECYPAHDWQEWLFIQVPAPISAVKRQRY